MIVGQGLGAGISGADSSGAGYGGRGGQGVSLPTPGAPYGLLHNPKMFGSGGGGSHGGAGGGKIELWIKETIVVEGMLAKQKFNIKYYLV